MAKPKVFISSTCYDLGVVRSELRHFIMGLGFEPIMSDHSDILYDPKLHTHDSCVAEVSSSDLLVLMIGSRLGGKALPSARALVSLDGLDGETVGKKVPKLEERLSITQLETIRAVELGVPIYAFIQKDVLRDHHLYERNKSKLDIIKQIDFPSIEKRDTAEYIFEFINYIRSRATNNSIFEFENLEDIRECLRSQWAQLFQRLLSERLNNEKARTEFRTVAGQIDDLKAVLLTSIGNNQLKETAKGALKYRRLIEFLLSLLSPFQKNEILSEKKWDEIFDIAEIAYADIKSIDSSSRPDIIFVKHDGTFYRFRGTMRMYENLISDWDEFKKLEEGARKAVYDALVEAFDSRPNMIMRKYDISWDEFQENRQVALHTPSTFQTTASSKTLGELLSDALISDDDADA